MTDEALKKELLSQGKWGEIIWEFLRTHPEARCQESPSYECEACKDTGWIENPDRTRRPCKCVEVKNAKRRLQASGLMDVIDRLTFDNFIAKTAWQKAALTKAKDWATLARGGIAPLSPPIEMGVQDRPRDCFSTDGSVGGGGQCPHPVPPNSTDVRVSARDCFSTDGSVGGVLPWLYCGGAVGSGKTHLCTAACGEALRAGRSVRYMLWTEESRRLKACVNDAEEYDRLIDPLKTCEVLYIDDLFKVQRGDGLGSASSADIRLAFELIDARYRNHRATVISCEWTPDELRCIDEGTGSRIIERSRGFMIQIAREKGRNMRLGDPA